MSDVPASRPCSKCGQILEPRPMGTTFDSSYNTVSHYVFGHNCPKQLEAYDNRIKEIENSSMNTQQKTNAKYAAGFMNAWAS